MSLAVFTWTPAHPYSWRPRRPVAAIRFAGSAAEQRVQLYARTLRRWSLPFHVDAASGYREAIDAFFVARGFSSESFLWRDLHDYARTGIALAPVSDGSTLTFALPSTGEYAGDYPINDSHVKLYRAGVLNGGTLSAGTDARTIITTSAPAGGGAAMTADYWYYKRVRLASEYEWSADVHGVFRTVLEFEEVAVT